MLLDMRFPGASLVVVVRRPPRRRVRLCLITTQPMLARALAAGGPDRLLSTQPTVEAALSEPATVEAAGHPVPRNGLARSRPAPTAVPPPCHAAIPRSGPRRRRRWRVRRSRCPE